MLNQIQSHTHRLPEGGFSEAERQHHRVDSYCRNRLRNIRCESIYAIVTNSHVETVRVGGFTTAAKTPGDGDGNDVGATMVDAT